jgi:hypothetical protein
MEATDVTFCTAVKISQSRSLVQSNIYHERTFQILQQLPDTDTATVILQLVPSRSAASPRTRRSRRTVASPLSHARRSSQACRFRAEGRAPNTTSCGMSSCSADWDAASSRPEGERSLVRVAEFLRPLVMDGSSVRIGNVHDARSMS